jgi:hypothetical protein
MTVQIIRPTSVPFTPPSRGPLGGSILEYAEIVESTLWLDPTGVIWSYNCIGIDVDPIDDCGDITGLTKRFDPPASADGGSFIIQGGVTCKPFGFDGEDPALKAAFDTMEPLGVSRGLAFTLFGSAVDLTPAAAVTPVIALGLLESYGYLEYAGQPVIHLGPGMVSQLMANGAITASGRTSPVPSCSVVTRRSCGPSTTGPPTTSSSCTNGRTWPPSTASSEK